MKMMSHALQIKRGLVRTNPLKVLGTVTLVWSYNKVKIELIA